MDAVIHHRVAEAKDAEAIRTVTHAAYDKWAKMTGRLPLPMRADYALALARHRFDLLEEDGRLRALIETTPQGDELLIVNVAVDPAFQGRGLGVRLLKAAEVLATEAGLKGTRLYTNKLYAENIALYAALGYVVEREEAVNGVTAVHMTKARA